MKVTITSLELKSIFKFFELSLVARKIVHQLKETNHIEFKSKGFWKTHYTMTLWETEKDMIEFASSGAHLEAMKKSKLIAKQIRTITFDADKLPSWSDAKKLLVKGKTINY